MSGKAEQTATMLITDFKVGDRVMHNYPMRDFEKDGVVVAVGRVPEIPTWPTVRWCNGNEMTLPPHNLCLKNDP